MPAKSEKQQKFFGMVYAYQKGKIPADKVSATVKRVAKTISPEDAKKYATSSTSELKTVMESFTYINETINDIMKLKKPDYIKGTLIDHYTAAMLKTVLSNLHENNQRALLSKSTDEIVALAYKMIAD